MPRFIKNFEISFFRENATQPYLIIDSDQPTPLRILFAIKKRWTQNNCANTMSLQIYNLAKSSRDAIRDYNDIVRVRAGWRGRPLSTVFQGLTTAVSHAISQPNVISSVMCLDGDVNWLLLQRVNVSAAVQIKTLIEEVASQAQIVVAANLVQDSAVLQSGYVADDKCARDIINDLANRAGCIAYMCDGDLYVVPPAYAFQTSHQINESTGMIGYPDRLGYNRLLQNFVANIANPCSWRVRTQLDGSIKVNDQVIITCPALEVAQVPVRAIAIVHEGDSYGALWRTTVDGTQVEQS